MLCSTARSPRPPRNDSGIPAAGDARAIDGCGGSVRGPVLSAGSVHELAVSQAAPGETIARAAGERGEAISRTAGALHGVLGSPAPASTAAQAAGSSRSAESPRRPSREGGAAGTWPPPSLSSSRLPPPHRARRPERTPGPAVPLPDSRWSLLSRLEPFALRSGESKPDHPIGRDTGWAFSCRFEEFLS